MDMINLKQDRSIILMLEAYSRQYLFSTAEKILAAEAEIIDHPDIHILRPLDGAKLISIEQVRQLQQRLTRKPAKHVRHMLVLDLVESLSLAAANSLLKVLEEPAGYCLSILLTQKMSRVLPTITSRCFKIKLQNNSLEQDLYANICQLFPEKDFSKADLNAFTEGSVEALADKFSPKEQIDIMLFVLAEYSEHKSGCYELYEQIISYKRAMNTSVGLDEQLMLTSAMHQWSKLRRSSV